MTQVTMLDIAERLVFVLIEPSHPGNIGSAARAMKTMGWRHLRVVAPRFPDALRQADTLAYASGATDILAHAQIFNDWPSAMADVSLTLGFADRPRGFTPPALDCAQACVLAVQEIRQHLAHRVALVFGTERTGLTSAQMERCQRLVQIDANPDYSSLNLAQAVQVAAYEVRRASAVLGTTQHETREVRYAEQREVEQFFDHFYQACVAVAFIDPDHPKKLFERMRRLLSRTRLEHEEVQLLRGLCKQMMETADRAKSGRDA